MTDLTHQPTGTITFLFTDIEKSTLLWDRHGSKMRAILAEHDALLRSAVQENEGWVVKTTGDGLHAAFPSAVSALRAAVDAQYSLQNVDCSAIAPDHLRVRMGLHTGEAQLRDGDYFGTAVNRAARIMSIGHGGQILLSLVTASLLRSKMPDQTSLRDLGEIQIRDLQGQERIYQLVAPDLPDDFPPLNASKERAGNLPSHISSFIGRNREMSEIRAALSQTRLLTLTGPGGTGKSRISIQVARDIQAEYQHGAWLVELAPVSDPQMVVSSTAAVFGLQGQNYDQIQEFLFDYLREKELLLILDNCEHLIDASARFAADVIRLCPQVTIFASSREGLGVYGEHTYHLPTLTLPSAANNSAEIVMQSEAIQLFIQRAKATQQGFQLSDQNAKDISDIVRRLDGIPLAIELAAARLNVFDVKQIASRLDHRFRLLTGGSRTAMPRQQTLRALIDWSYDLLDDDEKQLFRYLSVFKGGWSFEAAEKISEPLDTFILLPQLVSKSLVVRAAGSESEESSPFESRFHYLETIRQYALDRLIENEEVGEARDRHFQYIEEKADDIINLASPRTFQDLYELIYFQQDNLRSAVEWGIDRFPIRAIGSLWTLIMVVSDLIPGSECMDWIHSALQRLNTIDAPSSELEKARYQGMVSLSILKLFFGQLEEAFELSGQMISKLRDFQGDPLLLGLALFIHLQSGIFLGKPGVEETIIEAEQLLRANSGNLVSAWILAMVIMLELLVKSREEKSATFDPQINEINTILDSSDSLPIMEYMRFLLMLEMDIPFEAVHEQYEKSVNILQNVHNYRIMAMASSDWAHYLNRHKKYDQALSIYRRMFVTWRDLGHRAAMANILENIAFIDSHQSRQTHAVTLLGAAEYIREQVDQDMLPAERDEYENEVSALKDDLKPQKFEELWQHGRSLSTDAIIDLINNPTS